MARKKVATRKLEESSWLAQTLVDMRTAEFDKNGCTPKYSCIHTLKLFVSAADDKDNDSIYYSNTNGDLVIIVCDIPAFLDEGTDFSKEGMREKLLGLAERYKDDDGMYTVNVMVTHDLNSAIINVSKLMDSIRFN